MKERDLIAGRYRLLRPIGSGATGTVWAARHELLDREFALKIAAERRGRPNDRGSREARAMFLREVRIVGKLRHPNIVDIADAGELGPDEGLYLAMELLDGESLAARVAASPLGPAEALAILAKVGGALATAHGAGVIHRDLKPENIFLARGATGGVVPKLLDFGVSSAQGITTLSRDHLFGTPAYMSPEQALGEQDIDCRTDVWAIGVVLYEMLTGRHPFTADSYPALLPRIIEAPYEPLPAEVPTEVRTVVAGCLAKDRADRYAGADALVEAIERARATLPAPDSSATSSGFFIETALGVPASSRGLGPASSSGRGPRRSLALAIFAVPVVVGLAAAVSVIRRDRGPAPVPAYAAPAAASIAAPAAPPSGAPSAAAAPPAPDGGAPARATPSALTASGSARAAPKPRPPGGSVTRVNSAGF